MTTRPQTPLRPSRAKLFTPIGIAAGTVLGSLIAAAAMLWLNYRTLGYASLGHRVALGGVIAYLLMLAVASTLPAAAWISVLVIAAQAALAWWVAERLQGPAVRHHQAAGGMVHALPMSILVGLAAGLVAASLLLVAGRLLDLPIGIAPGP